MGKIALLDANSIGFAAQGGTKLTVGSREVQAIFGFIRTLRAIRVRFPECVPIVLWDGKAEWRYNLFPQYKDRSGKNKKIDDMRVAYKDQRPSIARAVKMLGVSQMMVRDAEADDLAASLSRHFSEQGEKVLLVTGDKDWMQLVDQNVTWYEHRQENSRLVTPAELMDEVGFATVDAFVQGKALMGDASDTIPGVGGFGEKGATEFIAEWGTVQKFFDMCDSGLHTPKGKVLQRFANNEAPADSKKYGKMLPMRDAYQRNLKLMDLRKAPKISKSDIVLNRGKFDQEAFTKFCEDMFFRSLLSDMEAWVAPFKR